MTVDATGDADSDARAAPEPPAAAAPGIPALRPGDPAPWFRLPCGDQPEFNLATVAGRYIVLSFFGSTANPLAGRELAAVLKHRALFDDQKFHFFGVGTDPADAARGRLRPSLPGVRYFRDFDRRVSRLYGAAADGPEGPRDLPLTVVLDPTLRVLASIRYDAPGGHAAPLVTFLRALPAPERHAGVELFAPVLVVPRVFEPAFCRRLIELYRKRGGEDSGFMREEQGKTVAAIDYTHKRRSDYIIEAPEARDAALARIKRRLVPEIHKAFHYRATRMERYIVACYDAAVGGYFKPHRDNTTKGTAHRRFAVTLNLNAEEYEGGELRFPEYGPRTYKPPTGGAVVFSCTLLHEATPVTKGVRYAFLPFLYDEEAAALREANNKYLGENVDPYRAVAKPKGEPRAEVEPAAAPRPAKS
jgi:predicted 2-oxoglutarate/Fe(II)-dependent dioxygenase YbiX/peroxiredoxin